MGLEKYDSEDFVSNNIIENRDEIRSDFDEIFQTKTTDEWLAVLLEHDIWCSQVNSFDEMAEDPQIRHNNMLIAYDHPTIGEVKTTGFPVKFSETPQKIYQCVVFTNCGSTLRI